MKLLKALMEWVKFSSNVPRERTSRGASISVQYS